MAQVTQRTWRTGKRKHCAWGFTAQQGGKQLRRFREEWTKEDAERALAEWTLGLAAAPTPSLGKTLGTMATEYLAQKERTKRTIRNDRMVMTRFKLAFGADTPLSQITAQRIAEWARGRFAGKSRYGRPLAAER